MSPRKKKTEKPVPEDGLIEKLRSPEFQMLFLGAIGTFGVFVIEFGRAFFGWK